MLIAGVIGFMILMYSILAIAIVFRFFFGSNNTNALRTSVNSNPKEDPGYLEVIELGEREMHLPPEFRTHSKNGWIRLPIMGRNEWVRMEDIKDTDEYDLSHD